MYYIYVVIYVVVQRINIDELFSGSMCMLSCVNVCLIFIPACFFTELF